VTAAISFAPGSMQLRKLPCNCTGCMNHLLHNMHV
jgi:hypothetical protein